MNLLRSSLVRALPADWQGTLDGLAEERGWPTSRDPARLGAEVAKLSAAYNAGDPAPLRTREALAARLGFSFARDVPKAAGAVRELIATGALRMPADRSLRVLDLGAGLGASTWGVGSALAAAAPASRGRIEAVCVDDDAAAISVASAICGARRGRHPIEVDLATVLAPALRGAREARGSFDVVLLGQVLSELDRALAGQVELVRAALDRTSPDGSVVIIEPALRDRTRSLHALRDALVQEGAATIFAPCLHVAPCPALAEEGAWCHEDLDVDLPPWLVRVAAHAGLRWQGLTFSYLVLRKDDHSLRAHLASSRAADGPRGRAGLVRVVSGPIVTKGKREAYLCGDLLAAEALVPGRVRARRLDRDESDANDGWGGAARGDTLACDPAVELEAPRIRRDASVIRVTSGADADEVA